MTGGAQMEEEFDQLVALFEGSGLPFLEIQYLIADVARIIQENSDYSIDMVNRELEDLGWGVDTLDDQAYGLMQSALDEVICKWEQLSGCSYQRR